MPSIVDQVPFNEYVGNGVATVYGFEFQLLSADDLVVEVDGVAVPASDYTLAGLGVQGGGTVTFDVAPANGAAVLISREIELSRATDYQTNGDLFAEVIDTDFNRLWQALQEQRAVLGSSVRAAYPRQITEVEPVAGGYLRWKADLSGVDSVPVVADPGMYIFGAAGAVARTVTDRLMERLSVRDFGAVGDGATDDTAAIQAAVSYAQALVSSFSTVDGYGVQIDFPAGTYLVTSPILVTYHGLSFVGAAGKGAKIVGAGTLFQVGDYTLTRRAWFTEFKNLNLVCSDWTALSTGVILYRTVSAKFKDVNFLNWYVGIDTFRASETFVSRCRSQVNNRTVQALAWLRMQGTDETATTSDTYTPGGGIHITDCEIKGGGNGVDTTSGVLLHSCDGFYLTQTHFTRCVTALDVNPLATAENHYIFDIQASNNYFDDPSELSATRNVWLRGTVRETIAMASGPTQRSGYQGFRFSNNLLRGAGLAAHNFWVQVTDGDSWFDSASRLRDFTISGNTFKQALQSNLRVDGGSANYVEPYALNVTGNSFLAGNSSSTAGVGSAVTANVESGVFVGNVSDDSAGASDYVMLVTVIDNGSADNPSPSVTVSGNDVSKTPAAIEPIRVAQAGSAGSSILHTGNNYPGAGREVQQTYKLTTTDATTTNIWSFPIQSSMAGAVTATVAGSNADGTKAVSYEFYSGFRNNGAASSLSSGGAAWTTVRAWNPDGIATIPSADLSADTLRVRVTGVAAETWTWVCSIDMGTSK